MTPEEANENARKLFKSGYNCTQAVVMTFAEELGLDKTAAASMCQPFGGGMSRLREVCGAVSGMFFCLGAKSGKADPKDTENKNFVYSQTQELASLFRDSNGSIVCRELLGLVPLGQSETALKNRTQLEKCVQNPESEKRTDEYYKKRPCEMLIGEAAEIFCKWLENQKKNQEESTN